MKSAASRIWHLPEGVLMLASVIDGCGVRRYTQEQIAVHIVAGVSGRQHGTSRSKRSKDTATKDSPARVCTCLPVFPVSAGFSTGQYECSELGSRSPDALSSVYKHQQKPTLSLASSHTKPDAFHTITTNILQQIWSPHADAPLLITQRSPSLKTRASHYERSL